MNRRYLTTGGIFLLALILRLRGTSQISFWFDELWTASHWSHPASFTKVWSSFWIPTEANLPLYGFLINLWTMAFGSSELSLILPSVILGAGSVAIIFLIAERLLNYSSGIFAAVLMATLSKPLYFSNEARCYSLILFLVSLCFYSRNSKKTGLWVIANLLLCWTHYIGIFFVLIQLAYDLWKNRYLLKWYAIPLGSCLGLVPLVIHQLKHWPTFPQSKHFPEFWNWIFDSNVEVLTLVLVGLLFIQTVLFLIPRTRKEKLGELLIYAYAPFLFILTWNFFVSPITSKRYFITIIPFAILVVTFLINELCERFPKAGKGLVGLILMTALYSSVQNEIRMNEKHPRLKEALVFVMAQPGKKPLFVRPVDFEIWSYYLKEFKSLKTMSQTIEEETFWYIDLDHRRNMQPKDLSYFKVVNFYDIGLTRVFKLSR